MLLWTGTPGFHEAKRSASFFRVPGGFQSFLLLADAASERCQVPPYMGVGVVGVVKFGTKFHIISRKNILTFFYGS